MGDALDGGAAGAAPISEVEDLGKRIMECKPKIWRQLKAALGVADREGAVALVQTDRQAQAIAIQLLGAQEEVAAAPAATATRKPAKPGVKF